MTDTARTTLWIIIILILAVIAWSFFGGSPEVKNQESAPVIQATTTEPVVTEDASTTISLQDNGDEALQGDLNKIDEQLKTVVDTNTN